VGSIPTGLTKFFNKIGCSFLPAAFDIQTLGLQWGFTVARTPSDDSPKTVSSAVRRACESLTWAVVIAVNDRQMWHLRFRHEMRDAILRFEDWGREPSA
jgi:hypothetical protein